MPGESGVAEDALPGEGQGKVLTWGWSSQGEEPLVGLGLASRAPHLGRRERSERGLRGTRSPLPVPGAPRRTKRH